MGLPSAAAGGFASSRPRVITSSRPCSTFYHLFVGEEPHPLVHGSVHLHRERRADLGVLLPVGHVVPRLGPAVRDALPAELVLTVLLDHKLGLTAPRRSEGARLEPVGHPQQLVLEPVPRRPDRPPPGFVRRSQSLQIPVVEDRVLPRLARLQVHLEDDAGSFRVGVLKLAGNLLSGQGDPHVSAVGAHPPCPDQILCVELKRDRKLRGSHSRPLCDANGLMIEPGFFHRI